MYLYTYLDSIPRLLASDALWRVQSTAIGTGSLKPEESKRIIDQWEDTIRPEQAVPDVEDEFMRIKLQMLQLGIPVFENRPEDED